MTNKEIVEGLKLLEDNMVHFDELQNDKGEWIDVHELLFEAIQALEQQPCDDAISRKDVEECKELMTDINGDTVYVVKMSDIRQLPCVTQKSETGYWINLEKKYKGQVLPFWGRYGCSKCGGYGEGTFNYCPNCGAKMVEPQESEEE